jgi:hypothetical protein
LVSAPWYAFLAGLAWGIQDLVERGPDILMVKSQAADELTETHPLSLLDQLDDFPRPT